MKINKIEKKLETKRKLISLILTLILHLILIIISSFWKFERTKKENIILTVRLIDNEQMNLEISSKPIIKNENKIEKKEIKNLKEEEKNLNISQEEKTNQNNIKDNSSKILENKKVFEDYEKEKIEERKKIEEAFFSETKKQKSSLENELEKILQNIEKKDSGEKDISILNKKEDKESKSRYDGGSSLVWIDGRERALIYKTDITIPEEFKKEGLSTSLILKLTVSEVGLITEVNIEKSSGFSILDYDIANQIKKWKFEKTNFKNRAILSLSISY